MDMIKYQCFFTTENRTRRDIFFTTERNGRKKTERGRKKQNARTGGLNGLGTEAHFFLYFGLPPDVQKGCPFWITHEIFHFEGYY